MENFAVYDLIVGTWRARVGTLFANWLLIAADKNMS